MWRADGVNEDLHIRLLAHDSPSATRVVEMNVGDEDFGQLCGVESRRFDSGVERREGRGRSGLDQRQLVRTGQQVGVDNAVPALKPEIDGPDALVDPGRRATAKCPWPCLPHTNPPVTQRNPSMYVQSMALLTSGGVRQSSKGVSHAHRSGQPDNVRISAGCRA